MTENQVPPSRHVLRYRRYLLSQHPSREHVAAVRDALLAWLRATPQGKVRLRAHCADCERRGIEQALCVWSEDGASAPTYLIGKWATYVFSDDRVQDLPVDTHWQAESTGPGGRLVSPTGRVTAHYERWNGRRVAAKRGDLVLTCMSGGTELERQCLQAPRRLWFDTHEVGGDAPLEEGETLLCVAWPRAQQQRARAITWHATPPRKRPLENSSETASSAIETTPKRAKPSRERDVMIIVQ
jgi:hypothetical protein